MHSTENPKPKYPTRSWIIESNLLAKVLGVITTSGTNVGGHHIGPYPYLLQLYRR